MASAAKYGSQVVVNHKMDKDTPQFDIHLFFEEIGVILDDHQYRDAISLVDMYHVYLRKRQVRLQFLHLLSYLTTNNILVWQISPSR